MDDLTALDRQIAAELLRDAGPSLPVDDAAIFTAITATQSPKRRFPSMFNATKFVIAGAIVALFGGFLMLAGPIRDGGEQAGSENAATTPASGSPSPDSRSAHRHQLDVDGVALSFEHVPKAAPDPDWEGLDKFDGGVDRPKDDLYISMSTHGPQGAEAMILWTTFPGGSHARPCLLDPASTTAEDLAGAMATAPGVEVVGGPSDAMIGGRAGKYVALTVVPLTDGFVGPSSDWEPGCDPAYFFGWEPHDGGAFWSNTDPGDTIWIWIVEVGGKLLVTEVEMKPDAGAAVERDIQSIIDSIRFE